MYCDDVLTQTMPVAASTLSLMMLSLDRYAAVKHPRVLARMGQQSGLPAVMVVLVWFGAAAVSVPIILARTVTPVSVIGCCYV